MKGIALLVLLATAGCSSEGKLPFRDDTLLGGGGEGGIGWPNGGSGGSSGGASGFGGSFGGSGGSPASCFTDWRYFSPACDGCMRGQCCSFMQACDTGSACRSVDDCRFDYCGGASDLMSCMQNSCYSSGFQLWQEYWYCMLDYCIPECSG
jgi:hypothetical protein